MARYLLVAMNGTRPGGDDDGVTRWYNEVHIPDLLAIPGVVSARRYRAVRGRMPGHDLWPYLAVYEIEADDLASLQPMLEAGLRPFHPDFDRPDAAHVFAELIHDGGDVAAPVEG